MEIEIPVPTYRTIVIFHFSDDKSELDVWDKEMFDYFGEVSEGFNASGKAYEIHNNSEGYNIARVVFDTSKISFGVIAHEIMHSVFFIMDHVNIRHCHNSEEAFTYLNEYLTEALHRELGSSLGLFNNDENQEEE